MLTYLVALADEQGFPRERMLVVHADLGRVEWPGTRDLAAEQAARYGLDFFTVARTAGLLEQVLTRHETLRAKGDTTTPAWPSSQARYCTSDQKTAQVVKHMTRLAAAHRAAGNTGPLRILNCLGLRAQESHDRARKAPLGPDSATNGRRAVTRWLPIFDWTVEQVWDTIRDSGLPYHPAYDAGMPRLSCVFCVMAGRKELVLAARLNPALAQEYLAVEQTVGHTFKNGLSMAEIINEASCPA